MSTESLSASKGASIRRTSPAGSVGRKSKRGARLRSIPSPTVLVVDDDPSVLSSLKRLLSASGFEVRTFSRPSELTTSEIPTREACMVIDIDLPEMTGIELLESLAASGRGLPTILITGKTDARILTAAARSDAVTVLFKPFEEEALLDAISSALTLSA